MSQSKRTVLVTGCSKGGIGAALAVAFHQRGLRVIATARDPSKMDFFGYSGIEMLPLDVSSEASIQECVSKLSSLDILVNNAGAGLLSAFSDVSVEDAKELFDLNVWAQVVMIQACLPLLRKSDRAIIVNNTSSGSIIPVPFQSIYNASKAALSMISDTMRLELEVFHIRVIELKTGLIRTNFSNTANASKGSLLRPGSMYEPAREKMERILRADAFAGNGTDPAEFAEGVVTDILKRHPPTHIYRGESAWFARVMPMLPFGIFDSMIKKAIGLDEVETMLKKTGL